MKNLLTLFIFLIFTTGLANDLNTNFKYPTSEKIKAQGGNIVELISRAEKVEKSKQFNEQLEISRKSLAQISKTSEIKINRKLNIPSFTPKDPGASNIFKNLKFDSSLPLTLDPPLIFVTLSMPIAELKLLLAEGSKIGAPVIIRGLYKDLKSTAKKIKELAVENGVLIDPTMFIKYQVREVPTFILPITNTKYVKGRGSVSLSYFLELVTRTGSKEESLIANRWRGQL